MSVAAVACLALLAVGCGAGMREFLGLEEADSAASIADLGQYHDPLVLLSRADTLFEKRNYLEAALTYERFLELHRIHKQADYAQFRAGLSYLKQFRSIDRDIEPVTKALKSFQLFLTTYPSSVYAADVKGHLATCRQKLAESELAIGRFYYRQGSFPAAISRLEGVIKEYGDLPAAEPALFLLGQAYAESGKAGEARQRLEQLLTQYPQSTYQQRAKERLAQLNVHDACGAPPAEHAVSSALC
ncbi:MAG: outer membrane protein assembly factor BamD [Nitrospirae bacterium]|nr:outer membrane protein assembly factor BamD [Nitrospirota bacterium]